MQGSPVSRSSAGDEGRGDEKTLFVIVHEMRAAPCSRDPNEPEEPVLLCTYISNDWSVANLTMVPCVLFTSIIVPV